MVVAVKIKSPKASSSKSARVAGLAQYIRAPESTKQTEKCVYFGARNFLSQNFYSQINEMIALAEESVRSRDPIRHDVISFKEHEFPTSMQVEQQVDLYLKQMGLEGHQVFYGMHVDTADVHIHLEVNRVHPVTLKAVEINCGFDREALQQVCARIEHAQGWQPEPNSRYTVQADGSMSARPERTPEAKPQSQVTDMEVRTGTKSAERIVIEDATPILQTATTWREVHDQLAAIGIGYERYGSGALMLVGDVYVKASAVARDVRFAALQKRLGPFEPVTQERPNVYFEHKPGSGPTEQNPRVIRARASNGVRQLSQCNLASGRNGKNRKGVLQVDVRPGGRFPQLVRWPEAARIRYGIDRSIEPLTDTAQPGWAEYAKARAEHYKARRLDTDALRTAHAEESRVLKTAQRTERLTALPMGEYRGGLTNTLRKLLAFEQAKAKVEIKERHRRERAVLKARYPQFPASYEAWLRERGQADHAEHWRYRQNVQDIPCKLEGDGPEGAKAVDIRDFHAEVDGWQIRYTHADARTTGFIDRGRSILIPGWKHEGTTLAAMQLAAQKWPMGIEVTGSPEYKEHCALICAQHGGFKIKNPDLQNRIEFHKLQLRSRVKPSDAASHAVAAMNAIERTIDQGPEQQFVRERPQ